MTANAPGVFCVSVDGPDSSACSIEAARRQRDLVELLNQARIPSNWLVTGKAPHMLPAVHELTLAVPRSVSRRELLEHLRKAKSQLSPLGQQLSTMAADPCQARSLWNLLVRHGCVVVRPQSTNVIHDDQFQPIRGGLWMAPLSCSFVGGSRRSVRSLFKVCRRKLIDASSSGRMFHLNVAAGNSRASWAEEMEALRALLWTADEEQTKGNLQFAKLSELPHLLGRPRSGKPMNSILHAA